MVTTYTRIVLLCLLSLAGYSQSRNVPRSSIPYATSNATGGVRLYSGIDQTGTGYALDATAGRLLKQLVDANTANFANYAPKAGVTNDFSVGGNLTIPSANGRYLGFTSFASGMTLSFKFGDDANSLANTWGGPMRLGGYHGIVIQNNASGALPALRVNGISASQDIAQFYAADGSLKFTITQAGGLKFPDGTVQTTASAGGSGGGTVVGDGSSTTAVTQGGSTTVTAADAAYVRTLTVMSEAAFKAAYAAIPATGGVLTTGPGSITFTGSRIDLNKPNVAILSYPPRSTTLVLNTSNNALMQFQASHNRLEGFVITSALSTTAEQPYSLIGGAEQFPMNGIWILNNHFSTPNVNQNAITFTPYSPTNESGTGVGNVYQNLHIENNTFTNIGRVGVEINLHVHADGKDSSAIYLKDFWFVNNIGIKLGTQNLQGHGMLLSIGGPAIGGHVDNNNITDARYGGLEFVSTQGIEANANWFASVDYGFSCYAVSKSANIYTRNLHIRGGGSMGTTPLKGRPLLLYDAKEWSVKDYYTYSELRDDIRSTDGVYANNRHITTRGVPAGDQTGDQGGSALSASNCANVLFEGNYFESRGSSGTHYATIEFGGSNNTNVQFRRNTIKRAQANKADSIFKANSNNIIVGYGWNGSANAYIVTTGSSSSAGDNNFLNN